MEESHLRHLQCSEPFVLFSGRDQNQLRKLAALGDGHAVLTYLLCLYNLFCNVFFQWQDQGSSIFCFITVAIYCR